MSENGRSADSGPARAAGGQPAPSAAEVWIPFSAGVVLLGVLLLFAVLKAYSFNFTRGDEHLYNAMSLLILDGAWPYRDFFFAHPPLPLYVTAAIFSVTGYSLVASKAVPILAAMSSGLHLYWIGRRSFDPITGVLATILFLFTFDVIRGSSHPTGANVAVAFILAGTHHVFARRFALAGALLGCATLTGVYALPMALMLMTLLALRSFAEAGRFALGFAASVGSVLLLFTLVTGSAIWADVVGYSLAKEPMSYSWFDKFENVFFLNFHAMMGFLPAIAWAGATWLMGGRPSGPPEVEGRLPAWMRTWVVRANPWGGDVPGRVLFFATIAFGYFFFYSNLKVYYSYYFLLVMPWMALLSASFAVEVVRAVWRAGRTRVAPSAPDPAAPRHGEPKQARRKRQREARRRERTAAAERSGRALARNLLPVAAGVLALVGTTAYRDRIGDYRASNARDMVRRYEFSPSPYLSRGINRLIEGAFWSDVRDRRDPPRGITRYLQHETIFAPTIDRFRDGVRAVCRPGETIFGEYSLAPYAAAVSDCRVAANLIDMNSARISSGESTEREWVEAVEADGLDVVVWREPNAYMRSRELRSYLLGRFPEVVFEWRDRHVGKVELRRRSR